MSWNGHYVIGYLVAIGITSLIGMKMVTVHNPAPCSTSVVSSLSGESCAGPDGTPASETPVASSCDNLREAILTGNEADIVAGMNAVLVDRAADDTSRKVAGYYTGRDQHNTSRQKRDILIIRDSCSL